VEKMKIIEKLKGQVTIFGRTIPAALAAVLAIAILSGLGYALLTAYITITGTATVSQSVVLDVAGQGSDACHATWDQVSDVCTESQDANGEWTIATYAFGSTVAGNTRAVGLYVKNKGGVGAPVKFKLTSATLPGTATLGSDVKVEIWSEYEKTNEKCSGTKLVEFTAVGGEVSLTDLDAGTSEDYCINHVWAINAEPGNYAFEIQLQPA
jgi:hypothetical protein